MIKLYIDNGKTVKTYSVKSRIAKAIMTLLETDEELVWSETREGYGVTIIDKTKSEDNIKINCSKTKCENCTNHNYCDYEQKANALESEE